MLEQVTNEHRGEDAKIERRRGSANSRPAQPADWRAGEWDQKNNTSMMKNFLPAAMDCGLRMPAISYIHYTEVASTVLHLQFTLSHKWNNAAIQKKSKSVI